MTVDKAGVGGNAPQFTYGAVVTNHSKALIASTASAALTFSDAKGTALTSEQINAGPILPGHLVTIGGLVGGELPKGTLPSKSRALRGVGATSRCARLAPFASQ